MHARSVLLRRDGASVTFWRLSVWQRMLVLDQLDTLAIIGENVYGSTRMWVCREGRRSPRRPDGRLDADDGEARCCFSDAGTSKMMNECSDKEHSQKVRQRSRGSGVVVRPGSSSAPPQAHTPHGIQ